MIPVVHTLKLYEIINKYFRNEEDSKSFISEVNNFIEIKLESGANDPATKSDARRLETEISKLEIKMGLGFKEILKWMIVLMITFASLILTFMKLIP